MYATICDRLRSAYDRSVDERDGHQTQTWKKRLRSDFLDLIQLEGRSRLLEVGAGTGVHGLFFKKAGLDVCCTDLSPALVECCRSKGLRAEALDFLSIGSLGTFDAIFSMNCFLHAPPEDLPNVLERMQRSLVDGGLLYWGQYGGVSYTGILDNDSYEPKRYFSMLSDEQLLEAGQLAFDLVSFKTIVVDRSWDQHFQSSVWRRRDA